MQVVVHGGHFSQTHPASSKVPFVLQGNNHATSACRLRYECILQKVPGVNILILYPIGLDESDAKG